MYIYSKKSLLSNRVNREISSKKPHILAVHNLSVKLYKIKLNEQVRLHQATGVAFSSLGHSETPLYNSWTLWWIFSSIQTIHTFQLTRNKSVIEIFSTTMVNKTSLLLFETQRQEPASSDFLILQKEKFKLMIPSIW